ncbi:hypothetical protein VTK26DRAFT_9273 [Humicola hyalothermophila]
MPVVEFSEVRQTKLSLSPFLKQSNCLGTLLSDFQAQQSKQLRLLPLRTSLALDYGILAGWARGALLTRTPTGRKGSAPHEATEAHVRHNEAQTARRMKTSTDPKTQQLLMSRPRDLGLPRAVPLDSPKENARSQKVRSFHALWVKTMDTHRPEVVPPRSA